MTFRRVSLSSSLFLCFHLLAPLLYTTSDASLRSSIQALHCSVRSSYPADGAYAANVNKFLSGLPENAISKSGGFYNGTVGEGPDTVYGLAMCPADYSRADCGDCLTAAAASYDGLPSLCAGSTTVLAMFQRCLIRYSGVDFFGTPQLDIFHTDLGRTLTTTPTGVYAPKVAHSLSEATAAAELSPKRFAASAGAPYVFVQCTWDLQADKCTQCLNELSSNATDLFNIKTEGELKSYSCTVRYSNTSFMVVPFTPVSAPPPAQPVNQTDKSPPPPQSVGQTHTSAPPSSAGGSKAATVGGVVAGVLCLAALMGYVCILKRKRNKGPQMFSYSYRQLAEATSNFDRRKILGAGTFGTVYKGKVNGMSVAVKKIKMPEDATEQGQVKKDFDNEIEVMKPLCHRNIIRLMGWCHDKKNLFHVYELIKKGNLEDHLYPTANSGAMDVDLHGGAVSGTTLLLDWPKRNNILIGIANGLAYLHAGCGERVLHRDIKPSNVVLDDNYNAKLCDFGLVTQFSHNNTHHSTDNVRGTRGYVDPAYVDTQRSSEQNDIYSFGILMLEVVCCEKPTVGGDAENSWNNLVERVRACHQRNAILDAADVRLRGDRYDDQLKRVLMIGLLCVQPTRSDRPHSTRVLQCLTDGKVNLPFLSPGNITLSTVNEIGSAASTTRSTTTQNSNPRDSTSSKQVPTHPGGGAGTEHFQTSRC